MDSSQEINTQRCNNPCNDPIRIGATCVAQIDGRFFLIIEIEIEIMGFVREEVIIMEISAAQAVALIASGVMRCQIVTTIPPRGNLICAFVVGQNAFLIFNVENSTDRLVLVRVPLCTII
ncbi:spore coat protein [Alkaliphilus sp. B6464]|uniref:spore coat protein n=1 Tax=Alkaliphilus sp. B6464 TaxID=2731219 RepID=UPI001BA77767|nr:spore coat protein [Alkaliphilus sp. B6464]QUH20290.1 spore coat protein [Alkaliphilus sp. B6464]